MMSSDEFPGLSKRQLTESISWRYYKHWGQGVYAGEGLEIYHGDRSGCLFEINGRKWTSPPCVVQARVYESARGWISAVFSYPHGIGIEDLYFWEIYTPDLRLMEDVERFETEEDMERRVVEILS